MKIKYLIIVLFAFCFMLINVSGETTFGEASIPRKTGYFETEEMTMSKTYPLDSMTTLYNGDVLLTKDGEAEIYNAKKKKFRHIGTHEAMHDVSTVTLHDGRVLLIGRSVNPVGIKGMNRYLFEEFNPNTEKFTVIFQHDDFYFPTKNAIRLMNGNVFLQGGVDAYVFNITTKTLSKPIQFYDSKFRYFPSKDTAIVMNDIGKVFIFGMGYCRKTDTNRVRNYVFKFDPDTNEITLQGRLKLQRLEQLKAYVLNHSEIAVLGGKTDSVSKAQSIKTYEIYNIQTGKSRIMGEFPFFINDFLKMILTYEGNLITNMPYGEYKNIYKPLVFNIKQNTSDYAKGKKGNGIDIHNPSFARLSDGCYLFAGGYNEKGLDSKKAYKYCP